jgi:endonuclease/exonuclease/phosphatase family metal-dependent hydrolase
MAINVQQYNLDIVPNGAPLVVDVHQNDTSERQLQFRLYSSNGALVIPNGATASIEGMKPDGTAFAYSASISGGVVTADVQPQMVVLDGDVPTQIKVLAGGKPVFAANFILRVQADVTENVDVSETEIPSLVAQAQAAAEAAEHATSDLQMELDALSARMDEFTNLPDGSTAGDAELADIRVAYNGTVYGNAGTAVREQVKQSVSDKLNLFSKAFTYDVQPNGLPSTRPRALSGPMLVDGEATIYVEYMGVGLQVAVALYTGEAASTFYDYADPDWHDASTILYKGDAKYIRLYFWKQNDLPLSDSDFVSARITVIKGYDTPVYYEVNTAEDKVARKKLNHALDNAYLKVCTWNVGFWNDGNERYSTMEDLYKWYRAVGAIDADMLFTQESPQTVVPSSVDFAAFMGNKYDYVEEYIPPQEALYASKGISSKYELYDVTVHDLSQTRTYQKGYIICNGKRICVINCHLDWTSAERRTEMNTILGVMQGEEYVICCGDFNVESVSEFDMFSEAGYKLANCGIFGQYNTWPHGSSSWPNEVVDNVIVSSNIDIQDVQMLSGTGDYEVSDHAALMVSLRIK